MNLTDRLHPPAEDAAGDPPARRRHPLRHLPLAVIAVAAVTAFVALGDLLSFEALERNYEALRDWRAANTLLAASAYAAVYTLSVAISLPGAIWLTLIGGFLFGLAGGAALVAVSATAGATLVFLAARSSLGALLRERAGGWVARLETRFREGEVGFLLAMRLIPAVPFFVANLAPAFLGARLGTFVWTTFVGILPGTLVFTSVGAGLGAQLARGERPDLGVIFEPHILGPLLGLAALALLPMVLRRAGIGRPDAGEDAR